MALTAVKCEEIMARNSKKQQEKENQRLVKLSEQEQKIKIEKQDINRKKKKREDQQKIIMGGLVKKSGINLNNNELLGMLLDAKERIEKDKTILDSWRDKGAQVFEQEQKNPKVRKDWKGDDAIVVSFDSEPSKETKNKLKTLDLIWNKHIRVWQGFAKKEEVEKTLEGSGAKIEVMKLSSV